MKLTVSGPEWRKADAKSFTYEEVDKSWRIRSSRDIFVHYLEMIQKDLDRRD